MYIINISIFKISLKQISLFDNSDRVCQEHYIKIGYILKI